MIPTDDRAALEPWARLDDCSEHSSFELREFEGALCTGVLAEVKAVLDGAERAARNGAWVAGFVTYDAAPAFDSTLRVRQRAHADPLGDLPLAWFGMWQHRFDVPAPKPMNGATAPVNWTLEWARDQHAGAVAAVKELIAAGDTYQLNLTARASAVVSDPLSLYLRLIDAQQSRFGAFISTGSHAIVCASPELFFELEESHVVTRPMKGTARRGRWLEEDNERSRELSGSLKDRAENVMIVDLLRSDLGRICKTGSVQVPTLFALERFPTVWQLTSTVTGELLPGVGLRKVFGSLFPCGSVTGAPKRSTMNAIANLEPSRRGLYCGAVGVIQPTPGPTKARFAVAIRTATVNCATGQAEYGTGGGITWASDPTGEWDELLAKTAILDHPSRPGGLFETIRRDSTGATPDLRRHLERFGSSAAYFDIPYDPAAIEDALKALPPLPRPARLRIILSADGTVTATASDPPTPNAGPVRLALAATPIRSQDPWMFHKTTDRSRYAFHVPGTADDVLLWNEDGHITETTIANVAVELDGTWWTPPLTAGLLPGIERAKLLRSGTLTERPIEVEDAQRAERLALVSALRGWRPACLIDPQSRRKPNAR